MLSSKLVQINVFPVVPPSQTLKCCKILKLYMKSIPLLFELLANSFESFSSSDLYIFQRETRSEIYNQSLWYFIISLVKDDLGFMSSNLIDTYINKYITEKIKIVFIIDLRNWYHPMTFRSLQDSQRISGNPWTMAKLFLGKANKLYFQLNENRDTRRKSFANS